jgi:biotin carboxylase
MAKVLLVDTNVSASPLYQYLINTGHEVYVTGGNPNDFLAKCARNYIQLDYSDTTALSDLIARLGIDYLVPGCNDLSYKVCATVNTDGRFLGIETIENNDVLNNKESFRFFATEQGLPVPKVYSKDELRKIEFPAIVKPVDAFSGRGITIIQEDNLPLLNAAIAEARKQSRSGSYLIEQYVSGQLYSHSAFIANGSIVSDMIVEEHCTANPFAVDTSRVLPHFPAHLLDILRSAIQKMTKALQLTDGLVHTQFIRNDNSVWLIEPTRRCPGDLYSRLIEMSTGLNYAENYVRTFLGLPYSFTSDARVKRLVMRHTVTDTHGGHFWTLRFNEAIRISEYVALCVSGDPIKPAPLGRIGILFTSADDEQEFENVYQSAINRTLYRAN